MPVAEGDCRAHLAGLRPLDFVDARTASADFPGPTSKRSARRGRPRLVTQLTQLLITRALFGAPEPPTIARSIENRSKEERVDALYEYFAIRCRAIWNLLERGRSERGQGTVEYVGLILLVSMLMIGMVAAMKGFNRSFT